MAAKKVDILPVANPKAELMQTQAQILTALPSLAHEVETLRVVTAADYEAADRLLGRIRGSRGIWKPIWERIQERAITPIRQGLEELYQMNRDVEKPHDLMEAAVKAKMKAFKQKELADAQAAERARIAEEDRLKRLAEEAQRKLDQARTPQMRGKLTAQVQQTQQQVATVQQQVAPVPVRGHDSTTRVKRRPKVRDIYRFCQAIAEGDIPTDCILLVQSKLDEYFKEDPATVTGWPGVVIEDDIQIVGR